VKPAQVNAALANVTVMTDVPRGYDTYTLFVSTSYDYSRLDGVDKITQTLSDRFRAFGDSIGPRNLAVFVSDVQTRRLEVSAGQAVLQRVDRSYGLTDAFEKGPYIIVLQQHPADQPLPGQTVAVISLQGHSPDQIRSILDELSLEIQRAHRNETPAPTRPAFRGFWESFRDGWNAGSTVAGPNRTLATIIISRAT
jgi:hypothetical protein